MASFVSTGSQTKSGLVGSQRWFWVRPDDGRRRFIQPADLRRLRGPQAEIPFLDLPHEKRGRTHRAQLVVEHLILLFQLMEANFTLFDLLAELVER